MTTRRTRIPGKILDPKKFENLPFHKGPLAMPAKQTMKKSEEELEKEKDFNIKHANEWGKKDVNKAIKRIEKEQGAIKRKTRRKRGRGKVEWDLLKNLNGENVKVKFNKEKAEEENMGEPEFTALLTILSGGNNDAIKINFTHHLHGEEEEHVFNKTEYENGIITVLGKSNSVYNKVGEAGGRKRKTRRKKRRKTRKNKRSKKRRGKKRKTRKRRRKRR